MYEGNQNIIQVNHEDQGSCKTHIVGSYAFFYLYLTCKLLNADRIMVSGEIRYRMFLN